MVLDVDAHVFYFDGAGGLKVVGDQVGDIEDVGYAEMAQDKLVGCVILISEVHTSL